MTGPPAGAGARARGAAEAGTVLRVCTWPHAPNPYQRLLHAALAEQGVHARVLPDPTRSHTINLALLPLTLARARSGGARVWHLHWVYDFATPWMARVPAARRFARWWYEGVLRFSAVLGLRLVWTAHNVLPHEQVFDDDLLARRTLLRLASGVVLHDERVRDRFADLGLLLPEEVIVAPHGPYEGWTGPVPDRRQARERLGWPERGVVLLFFGRVSRQKGADQLVEAFTDLVVGEPAPDGNDGDDGNDGNDGGAGSVPPVVLVVAGACPDELLARRLTDLAGRAPGRVRLDLRHLPEDELALHLAAADAAVLPFSSVTTSGSVLLAMSLGTLVVIPALPAFDDLAADAALKFRPGAGGLRTALALVIAMSEAERDRRGAGGLAQARARSWTVAASRTAELYRRVLAPHRAG